MQYDKCPCKKRCNLDTDTDRTYGKKCEHTDRRGPCDPSHAFTSQGTLGIANKHHKLGELRKDSLPGAFRKTMALLTP